MSADFDYDGVVRTRLQVEHYLSEHEYKIGENCMNCKYYEQDMEECLKANPQLRRITGILSPDGVCNAYEPSKMKIVRSKNEFNL